MKKARSYFSTLINNLFYLQQKKAMIAPLNNFELQLVTDPTVLLAKNRIIQIVYGLFGQLAQGYENELVNKLKGEGELINAKISRGENYLGLPYVIMDYPRQFGKTSIFAIRSFFWWGNFFSITLQLSGDCQRKYTSVLNSAINNNYFKGWYISSSDDQWQHYFDKGNYQEIEEGRHYNIESLPFVKLAKKIPLNKWDEADTFFVDNFSLIINSLEA